LAGPKVAQGASDSDRQAIKADCTDPSSVPTGMPDPAEITDVRIERGLNATEELTEAELREILRSALPIDSTDPSLHQWSYAPWHHGTFVTTRGMYRFDLYLGGRGRLTDDTGSQRFFSFEAKKR
jgi:hypothetical protein